MSSFLRLGEGELKAGGFKRPSILADAMEALFGAIFLDSDFETVRRVITQLFTDMMKGLDPETFGKDAKTQLQEYLQGHKLALPEYQVVATHGAAHNQEFEIECTIGKFGIHVFGTGSSRRAGEQEAAQKQMQQKQQELEKQNYLRMQKQMQRQTQTMPVQRAGMSYQTGIPTGQSTMSGGRAAATSGQGMSRPAYGIRQGMQRQQPVQRGNAPIQRSVQQPILQTQAAELCMFTVHRVHQEEVCQFLTQRGIGYHIH